MNYILILSCLFAACLITINGQTFFPSSTRRGLGLTTGRPLSSTTGNSLTCVCSCCSGILCKPVTLRSFADSSCTTKACKDKCKVFEPKNCDHTFMGTNDAYCTMKF